MTRTSLTVALAVAATFSVAFQSTGLTAGRKLHSTASTAADRAENKRQMFMLDTNGKWTRMKAEKDHLDSGEMWRDDIETVAYFWKLGKSYYISLSNSSPSGDWFHTTELTYRADGTLAYAKQVCSAFSPVEGIITREYSFDTKGRSTGSATKGTDMDGKKNYTGQKLKELISMEKELGSPIKPYMNAKKLPFAKLIK